MLWKPWRVSQARRGWSFASSSAGYLQGHLSELRLSCICSEDVLLEVSQTCHHQQSVLGGSVSGTLSAVVLRVGRDVGVTLPSKFSLETAASLGSSCVCSVPGRGHCLLPPLPCPARQSLHSAVPLTGLFAQLETGFLRSCLNCFYYLPCPCLAQSSGFINIFIMNNE